MVEKEMKILKANNLNALVKGANELSIKQEDIVQFVTIPNGYVLVYYG